MPVGLLVEVRYHVIILDRNKKKRTEPYSPCKKPKPWGFSKGAYTYEVNEHLRQKGYEILQDD